VYFLFFWQIIFLLIIKGGLALITLYVLAVIIFLIILFLILPLYLNIEYRREAENDYLGIIISPFGGIMKFKIKVPFIDLGIEDSKANIKLNEEIGENIEFKQKIEFEQINNTFAKLMGAYYEYKKGILYFKRKIKIIKLDWDTEVGIGDAALSAILVGNLWAVKGILISALSSHLKLNNYRVNIVPDFNHTSLKVYINCIIGFKPGHTIIGAIKISIYKLKEVIKNV
jgi:hypothetical protein